MCQVQVSFHESEPDRSPRWCIKVTFFTLPGIESNNPKCCPALLEAWVPASVPANAGTHAEASYFVKLFLCNNVSCEFDKFRVDIHLCNLRTTQVVRF